MTKKKKIVLIVVGIFTILGVGGFVLGTIGMGEVKEFKIANINLDDIKDGEYTGQCTIGRWSKTIRITVKNHQIIKTVFIKKTSNISVELMKKLNIRINEKHNTNVDVVSGASITSKAYLIAVADALKKR